MSIYFINSSRTPVSAATPAAAVAKDLRDAGYKASRASGRLHVTASRATVEITNGVAMVHSKGRQPVRVTIGVKPEMRLLGKRRATRSNPAVECSASPKRDRYRAAKVMHKGEWVQNAGCWDAKGVPSYVGKGETGKRRVIAKKAVRQKASRTPKFVKGARARKAR